ncbi:MAG: membrane protein insertase YidC [Bacteroidales bacterium]|nr:membrane protein insertase YidC [Bacteroidales bacterium]
MNKNSILGFVLIGAILIGFSWYNTKVFKEQERLKQQQDSIALAQGIIQHTSEPTKPDTVVSKDIENRDLTTSVEDQKKENIYKETLISAASKVDDIKNTLENEKIKVEFSNFGAQPKNVEIKNNYTYDSLALMLVKEKGSEFTLNFYAGQQLSTKNFGFDLHSSSDTSLVYRLYIDSISYVEYAYTLPKEGYMVDLNINMVELGRHIPRNQAFIDLEWFLDVPRQEKGYNNEKNYSTIVYKFPNSTSVEDLGLRKDKSSEDVRTRVNWVAFQQQFFSAILVAQDHFNSGLISYNMYPEDDPERNLMNCTAIMQLPYSGEESVNIPLQFYFGPNHFKTLKSYDMGFEKIVPLGGWIIGWVNRYVIIVVFDFLSKFINSYGIIILILTILIKLIISPLTIKSYLSSAKMRVLKPEVDKINAKYPKQEDAMKKQQETMALYKKANVSMFGGCLPMLLQFPILFAMFRFFPASFELRQEGFLWAQDLSAFDSILDLPFTIPLYGDHVSLFALLMAFSMHFYSRMNMDQMNTGPQMAGMKYMSLYFMPLFLLVIGNNFSSGLSYYYLLSNLFTMGQTWIIRKYFVDEDKIYAKLKEKAAAPKKKSKFQARLDEAYKKQQQQAKTRK